MADEAEVEEHLEEAMRKSVPKDPRAKEEDDARRAARRAVAHIWSKTERMNCERALLSYGYGRWARIKEAAAGGTRLRGDDEVERFGVAFICLCVGVQIGAVGGTNGRKPDEEEGIAKAREALRAVGGHVPTLSPQVIAELEPLVNHAAHGHEYAERVHKMGPDFLKRLVRLKRNADAIEREAYPLRTFRAPPVPNGAGREADVPWCPSDDAMLLLGVYKHGYRAYLEIRDDPELRFVCRDDGPPLPPPLRPTPAQNAEAAAFSAPAAAAAAVAPNPPPVDYPASLAVASAVATTNLAKQGYDAWDLLPFAPASDIRRLPPPPPSNPDLMREASFPSEKAFKVRMDALLNAIAIREGKLQVSERHEAEWEEDWARGVRGDAPVLRTRPETRPSKQPKVEPVAKVEQPEEPRRSFGAEIARLWSDDWSMEDEAER